MVRSFRQEGPEAGAVEGLDGSEAQVYILVACQP